MIYISFPSVCCLLQYDTLAGSRGGWSSYVRPPGVGRDPPPAKAELNHTLGGDLKGEGPGHSPSLGVGRECLSPESHVKFLWIHWKFSLLHGLHVCL